MIIRLTLFSEVIKNKNNSEYKESNYYYLNSDKKWYIRYGIKILFLLISFIPYARVHLRPNININILYIIWSSIPMLIHGFLLFGQNLIFNISLKVANKALYNH